MEAPTADSRPTEGLKVSVWLAWRERGSSGSVEPWWPRGPSAYAVQRVLHPPAPVHDRPTSGMAPGDGSCLRYESTLPRLAPQPRRLFGPSNEGAQDFACGSRAAREKCVTPTRRVLVSSSPAGRPARRYTGSTGSSSGPDLSASQLVRSRVSLRHADLEPVRSSDVQHLAERDAELMRDRFRRVAAAAPRVSRPWRCAPVAGFRASESSRRLNAQRSHSRHALPSARQAAA